MFTFPTTLFAGDSSPPVEFVDSNSVYPSATPPFTLPLPAGTTEGDLIIILLGASSTAPKTVTCGSGYTTEAYEEDFASGSLNHVGMYTKVAGAAEADPTITWSATVNSIAMVLVYRNVGSKTYAPTFNFTSSTDTNTSNSIADDNGISVVFWFGNRDGTTALGITTPPTGMTNREQRSGTGGRPDLLMVGYDQVMAGLGPTTETLVWDTSSVSSYSLGMELRPA